VYPASQVSEKRNGFEFPFTQADFQTIVSIVYERSGIVLAANKRDMAYARLVQRLRALELNSFHDYCALLNSRKGAEEIGYLINAITTNLTKFFREAHHFEHLRKEALPELVKSAQGGAAPRIKIWSAGCSSGEEPYSIAMTSLAARAEIGRDWDLNILATDLDTATLEVAKAGIYPKSSLETVPAGLRERFFEVPRGPASANLQVSRPVQSLIMFKPLNLIKPWPTGMSFDVIFCRNVTIYFDAKTKESIINRFHSILKDGGWLYVGHSESLHSHTHQFKLCGRTIYRKIPG
jgi:chemotaxis protein methyltransferase CheR